MFQTFLEVVSELLEVSSTQSPQKTKRQEIESEDPPGTILLNTLDRFALGAFNITLGSIAKDNTSKFIRVYAVLTNVTMFRRCDS